MSIHKGIIYTVEYKPFKERFEDNKDKIFNLLKTNGYMLDEERKLFLRDVEDKNFEILNTFYYSEKYIRDCKNYLFKKDNLQLEINTYQIKLTFLDFEIKDIGFEFNILYEIIELMEKLYEPFSNNTFRIKINYSENMLTNSIKEINKIAENEKLDMRFAALEKGVDIKSNIDTIYRKYGLFISRTLKTCEDISSHKLVYNFHKNIYVYEEDSSIYYKETFNSVLLNKLTQTLAVVINKNNQ